MIFSLELSKKAKEGYPGKASENTVVEDGKLERREVGALFACVKIYVSKFTNNNYYILIY